MIYKLNNFSYLYANSPEADVVDILGDTPKRWGRMDRLSRLVVVETGRVLKEAGLIVAIGQKVNAGLIGGTQYGSLETDLAFAETVAQDPALASPMLFGYTLPNISIAEAASQYGLIGPVYSVYSSTPMLSALEEASRWLADNPELEYMVAGSFDVRAGNVYSKGQDSSSDIIEFDIKVVRK